jgi:RimJ/RimL family protein N-acetyltransferase
MNWRGQPLVSHEVIVNLIGATKTRSGLRVKARLDKKQYPRSIKVSDEELATVNLIQHKAELRKLIADPCMRGQGLGKEAALLWLNYGMLKLGLKKIYLTTMDTNTRNIRLNESLGFKVEGILRNEILFDGRYRDVLRMGLWLGTSH